MKKIVNLILILLVLTLMIGSVYAALTYNVEMYVQKTEFSKGEEFTVEFNLSNIQSDRGIIAFGGTLEYDKDSLTMLEMKGTDKWSNPSYNETKGKLVTDRNGFATEDETVFSVKFLVKEESKKNLVITLKDISVSSGEEMVSAEDIYKNITIKEDTSKPTPDPEPEPTPEPTPDPTPDVPENNTTVITPKPDNSTHENVTDNSTATGKLPHTGNDGTILVVAILGTILITSIFYIKMKIKK